MGTAVWGHRCGDIGVGPGIGDTGCGVIGVGTVSGDCSVGSSVWGHQCGVIEWDVEWGHWVWGH